MRVDITREGGCFRIIVCWGSWPGPAGWMSGSAVAPAVPEEPWAWPKSAANIASDGRRDIARDGW